jgi:hypothetical protein
MHIRHLNIFGEFLLSTAATSFNPKPTAPADFTPRATLLIPVSLNYTTWAITCQPPD